MSVQDLILQLRRRIGDEKYSVAAFTITCLDRYATDVDLEVQNGVLRTSVLNGSDSTPDLFVSLNDPQYDTLYALVSYLGTIHGYKVNPVEGMYDAHASIDLEPISGVDIRKTVTLRTHRFSDEELDRFIRSGARRHNPSYSVELLPRGEHDFVLNLAQVEALRAFAVDLSKRGQDSEANGLLAAAAAIETTYTEDRSRLLKALTPVRADDDAVHEGDAIVGSMSRESLRNGSRAKAVANLPPNALRFLEVNQSEVQDVSALIRWRRTSETSVYNIELWRDTQPNVQRVRDTNVYQTTSKRVWSARTDRWRSHEDWGKEDRNGELVSSFLDGFPFPPAGQSFPGSSGANALEPSTVYYYRLYIVDRNGEFAASEVLELKTKPMRAYMSRDANVPALSVQTGPRAGGTAVTLRGVGFTALTEVTIGGKAVGSLTLVDSTTLTFTSPATGPWSDPVQDVVVTSDSGLVDVYPAGWRYS